MLRHTKEQTALSEAVRALLAEQPVTSPPYPGTGLSSFPGFDRALWRRLSEELGISGLLVPEEFGGAGGAWSDLAVVLEAMGRSLHCSPFLSSAVLAVEAVLAATDTAARDALLPGLADGTLIGAVALSAPVAGDPDAGTVTGVLNGVLDGDRADVLVVRTDLGRGEELVTLRTDQPGVRSTPEQNLDVQRPFARVVLDRVRVQSLVAPEQTAATLAHLDLALAVALAAEQAGGARRCLEDTVAHASDRYQFSRPIGSFQSVKHRAAQVLVEVISGEAAARDAAHRFSTDPAAPETLTSVATAVVATTTGYLSSSRNNMQTHGGISFTWEATPHLHHRRSRTNSGLLGGTARWRALLAAHLLDQPA